MVYRIILLGLASILFFPLVVAEPAQKRTNGVAVGFWGEYAITYSGNETLLPEKTQEWMRINVQKILGTTIIFDQVVRYADQHEHTDLCTIDVDTGEGNGTAAFIAANLSVGDLIYRSPTNPFDTATINETVVRTYLSQNIEVNRYNQTFEDHSYEFCWGKESGSLLEWTYFWPNQVISWKTFHGKISGASMIAEFPSFLTLLLFMTLTILAVIVARRNSLRSRARTNLN